MRRFGDLLLGLGLVVGIGAIVGYEMDIIPSLPPAVLKLVLYKLIFVGGVGLLVAGAFIRRLASRIEPINVDSVRRPIDTDAGASRALPPPPATEVINREPAVREKPPSIL